MSYLGRVIGNCLSKTGHTKQERCDVIEEIPVAMLLAPSGTPFPLDQDEFNDNLASYINEGKLIPVLKLADAAAEGGDANVAQVGSYGSSRVTNINGFVQTFTVEAGDCMFKNLKDLEGNWDVFLVDRHMKLRGYAKEANGTAGFYGHDADIFVTETRANAGTAYSILVRVGYGVNYDHQRKNRHVISVETIPEGLAGVVVEKVSTGVIKVVSQCGGTDYTSLFASAVSPEMFINKAGEAVTTATYDEDTGTITIVPTTSPIRVAGLKTLIDGNVFGIDGVKYFTSIA
ncbi:hypothetical protein D0T49_04260 [Paludibacter sp. 221]|uniref:hypothetical protein n=1 Tax=Paludibacter sp. 221 TaxID=2302939 RepID=UPI0013D21C0B|nr:hypothetical protein [Paludibacter sp. 221]NDV46253.1 hypothetical protein [Paludibacter sp. 221]